MANCVSRLPRFAQSRKAHLHKARQTARFLSIFAYTILIFFVDGFLFLGFLAVNIAAMIAAKVTPGKALQYLRSFLPFVLLAAVVNVALGYGEDAVNLSVRLVLICNITQCYKKVVSADDLADAIAILFSPLKVFNVEGKDLGLVVCISLAFIPVLRRDFNQIRTALRARGMKVTASTMKYLLKPFFIGILQRTNEISQAIRTKGYDG
ncbi:MAG: energy-coupling factor transporter transmembrane protein EcfT [Spirochaetaceae bacterium]|jgi:energy-coupling factor transport system permease protein|nr:energy-coupling factor transporter transmembrane protein EcfT [Spirochaetaceae bacterium]